MGQWNLLTLLLVLWSLLLVLWSRCLVVLLSLLVHGSVIGVFLRRRATAARAPRAAIPTGDAARADDARLPVRITIDDVRALEQQAEPIVFVDARAPRSYNSDPRQITGSVRIPPDDPVRAATEQRLSQHATLVVYCA